MDVLSVHINRRRPLDTYQVFSPKSETPPEDPLAVSCYQLPYAREKFNRLPRNQGTEDLIPIDVI
jgi:hypothetical protein